MLGSDYRELIVPKLDNHAKKFGILIGGIALTAAVALFSLLSGKFLLLLIGVALGFGTWYLWVQNCIEYEYIISGDELEITKILAQSKRKPMLTVPLKNLVLTSAPKQLKSSEEIAIVRRPENVPSSIMIRGMLADEAIPLVERYLDQSMRAGYSEVSVIHGHGEGILRKLVHQLCKKLPYVADFRLGEHGEGGWGVTIVKFR